jgi:hypothetical protein
MDVEMPSGTPVQRGGDVGAYLQDVGFIRITRDDDDDQAQAVDQPWVERGCAANGPGWTSRAACDLEQHCTPALGSDCWTTIGAAPGTGHVVRRSNYVYTTGFAKPLQRYADGTVAACPAQPVGVEPGTITCAVSCPGVERPAGGGPGASGPARCLMEGDPCDPRDDPSPIPAATHADDPTAVFRWNSQAARCKVTECPDGFLVDQEGTACVSRCAPPPATPFDAVEYARHPGFRRIDNVAPCSRELARDVSLSDEDSLQTCGDACWSESDCRAFSVDSFGACRIFAGADSGAGGSAGGAVDPDVSAALNTSTYLRVATPDWTLHPADLFKDANTVLHINDAAKAAVEAVPSIRPGDYAAILNAIPTSSHSTLRPSANGLSECDKAGCAAAVRAADGTWWLADGEVGDVIPMTPSWGSVSFVKNPLEFCDDGPEGAVLRKNADGECWAPGAICESNEFGNHVWTESGECGQMQCTEVENGTRSGADCSDLACDQGFEARDGACVSECPAGSSWDPETSGCVDFCTEENTVWNESLSRCVSA